MKRLDWRKGTLRREPGFKPGCQYMCIKEWNRSGITIASRGEQIIIDGAYTREVIAEYSFYASGHGGIFIATQEEMFKYIRPSYE